MEISKIIECIFLISLVVLSIITIMSNKLLRAVIYLFAFSFVISIVYLLLNAPDVAIAEAVIGCTISTVLLVTALKKHKIITIYLVKDKDAKSNVNKIVEAVQKELVKHELEPQVVVTSLDYEKLHDDSLFDILIIQERDDVLVYTSLDNQNTQFVESIEKKFAEMKVRVIAVNEEEVNEG
jgi:uncharacterized MnhB-related membrane protein